MGGLREAPHGSGGQGDAGDRAEAEAPEERDRGAPSRHEEELGGEVRNDAEDHGPREEHSSCRVRASRDQVQCLGTQTPPTFSYRRFTAAQPMRNAMTSSP